MSKLGNFFKNPLKTITHAASDAWDTVKGATSDAWDTTKNVADDSWRFATSSEGLALIGGIAAGVLTGGALAPIVAGAAGGGMLGSANDARRAQKQAKNEERYYQRKQEEAAEEAAIASARMGVTASGNVSSSYRQAVSDKNADTEKRRRKGVRSTINDTNLLGYLGGNVLLGG